MKRFWSLAAAGMLSLALIACGGDDDDDSGNDGGSAETPASPKALALDTAWGANGLATLPLSTTTHDRFMAVTQGSDGKTYGAGFIVDAGDQAFAVARIDANGKLDPAWGTGGIASVNVAVGGKTAELARAVVVQSSGKVVIAGPIEKDPGAAGDAARDTDVAVVRFDTSGKLDATFGTNGVARIDFGAGRITTGTTFVGDNSWGLGNLAGDKLVIFGSKLSDDATRTDTDFVLASLTSAGALDTAFGTGGKVVVDVSNVSDNPRNVLVHDGKIVASGYSNVGGVVQPTFIRVDSAGKLDAAFGANGVASFKVLDGVTEAYGVVQQGSSYVAAGYGRGADNTEKVDLVVYRFSDKGVLDTTFGTGGSTRVDIAKEDDRARNVTALPDGRILAVGSGKRDAANIDGMLVLMSKDGVIESGFGEAGHLITDLGGPADAWYGVFVAPDKKSLIIAGYKGTDANSAGNDDAVIARILL